MERLTNKNLTKACNDPWDYCGLDHVCKRDCHKPEPCRIPKMVHRLAEIEDILGDDYDMDRLRELVEADRDGRCVVLPCHIGDPVFMAIGRSKITGYEEDACDGFYIGRNGVLQVKAQNNKGNHGTYGVIGQTAELTREAAEAALKGERNG